MIRFFKWFNNKIEMSALWLAGYCFILRIFCEKIFNSISNQTIYAIGMIIGIVFSFLAYHPLLGAMVGTILFIVTGLIYMACDIHKKKKQA